LSDILIIAGEVSGDLHAANLMTAIARMKTDVRFFGIGGDNMINSGLSASYHIRQLSFLGFAEVIKHLPFIRRVKKHLLKLVEEKNIRTAILVDYPGFNLNIAKRLKQMNVNVIYYISPQIWAWGRNRIKKIQKYISRMLVVFPFEKEFYKGSHISTDFVGHPLVERIKDYKFLSKDDFYKTYDINIEKEILLIMPGSRIHEIKLILPKLISAAKRIAHKYKLQLIVSGSNGIDNSAYSEIDDSIKVIYDHTYELIKYSKFGIIKSGTSTLESSLLGLPFVVVYRISLLSYLIGRFLINLKSIAIPNIILGKKIVPELIQNDLNEKNLFDTCDKLLSSKTNIDNMKNELNEIWDILGSKNASEESAKIIVRLLNEVK
jgi:lipid-A-disaccharide synthase